MAEAPASTLFDEILDFLSASPTIEPLTPEGRVTTFLFEFNHPERIRDRQEASEIGLYPCRPSE